ncbi:unnamed protein product [Acanthocheilonema viteae]|uniref:Clc-like protein n=1 Tax=Acanthocheilonema viteae TaxID=6277 RepID=A0A498SUP4_ACAVI|nr:unnamed protein product [Acanthocheilonema viteae]
MGSTAVQKGLLAISIVLIVIGLGFTFAGVFSPAWQVVDIREFRAEHQHGLWWDCTRAEKHVVAVADFYAEEPLHCMYKFDRSAELVIETTLNNIDEDGAAGESEHHRFWVLCSLIADGVFFLAANRVDNRFVQGMVGSYEQRIGYAFYVHLIGTLCWMVAFLFALLTTYKFFTERYSSRKPDQIPIFSSGAHFRSDADPPLLEKYNVAPSRTSPPVTYIREHTYRVTSA